MLSLLLACSADPAAPDDPGTTPYLVVPTTTPEPFDRAWTESALASAIALAPTLEATTAVSIYRDLRALGDAQCPPAAPYDGYEYWYAQCTADSGATFTGYSYDYTYTTGAAYTYDAIYLASSIVHPDGTTLAATGSFGYELVLPANGPQTHTIKLNGTYDWGGEAGGWVGEGLVPDLETTRTLDGDVRTLEIDGGVSGLSGAVGTVEYTEVAFTTQSGCAEPLGTISARTAGGEWFDVTFDGEGCDGCGVVMQRGLEVGEACADFTAWATWEAL